MSKSMNGSSPIKANKGSMWYGVTSPELFSIKGQYFVAFAGIASLYPFLVLFYGSLGLTTAQIGVIEFVNIVISMISLPIIGSIADKSGRHSLVLAICIIIYSIPGTSMGLFSAPDQEQHLGTLNFSKPNTFEFEICTPKTAELLLNGTSPLIISDSKQPDSKFTASQLSCKDLTLSNWSATLAWKGKSSRNCSVFLLKTDNEDGSSLSPSHGSMQCTVKFPIEESENTSLFLWICLLRSLGALSLGPAFSLSDAIAYGMLGPEHRASWGQQRMMGSLAWGLGAGIMGVLIDAFHTFKICFATFGALSIGAVFTALFWLPRHIDKLGSAADEQRLPFFKALRTVLVSPVFCIMCVVAIASGMLLSISQVIWPQHIQSLGGPKIFFGLAAALVCTFEIPSLLFAGAVVDRVGAPVCFLFMFLAYTIRFGVNSLLTPAVVWVALPVEILHLFCFGLFFSAATRTAAIIAPPGTSSAVQAFLAASYGGVGTGFGVLLGSIIYHKFGGQISFLIYASFAFCCFLVLLVLYFVYLRKAMARIMNSAEAKAAYEEDGTPLEEKEKKDPLLSPNNNTDEL